jgi:hypothetical protein
MKKSQPQLSEWDIEAIKINRKYMIFTNMMNEMKAVNPKLYKKYSEILKWVDEEVSFSREDELGHAWNVVNEYKHKYGINLLDGTVLNHVVNGSRLANLNQ